MLTRRLVRPIVSPLVRSVTQRGRRGVDVAALAAAVAAMAPRAWYERSNLSTLYVEHNGLTPVAAAGATIGRGLSRDQGLARGPEMMVSPELDSATGWTLSGGVTITGGEAVFSAAAVGSTLKQATLTAGKTYELVYTITSLTSGNFRVYAGDSGPGTIRAAVGTFSEIITCVGTTEAMIQARTAGTTARIGSFSVKEIPGNHQIQATPAARPLYQVGPKRAVFDGVDDVLTTAFPAALGAACTVGRAIPGTGAVITTGVNIGTSFADNVTAAALVIIDRALTAGETTALTAYLNQQLA